MQFGFLEKAYKSTNFLDDPAKNALNRCQYRNTNVFQEIVPSFRGPLLRGIDLSSRGCPEQCCEAVDVTATPTPYIVLLKDESGVVAQKVAANTMTVEFRDEDVRPFIPYKDINLNSAKIPKGILGTTNLRFESALGRYYYLTTDGTVKETEDVSKTSFQLAEKRANVTITDSPIYSIRELNTTKYLVKNNDDTINVSSTINANADWVIKPAINGAHAFVSIEHANIPGYYLVTEMQDDKTYKAKAKQIDVTNDVDVFFACWRLYPAI